MTQRTAEALNKPETAATHRALAVIVGGLQMGAGWETQAAYEWHNRYEEEGLEGLRDRPRPGRQPRVDAVTSTRFKERIVAGAELVRGGAFYDRRWPYAASTQYCAAAGC
jgi:transposase